MKRVLLLVSSLVAALPVTATLNVVTTTSSMGVLVRSVAGDSVKLSVLAPPDRDVHVLQARPSMMIALRNADLLVAVGAELEVGWLPAALQGASNGKILPGSPGYFEAAAQVPLIEKAGAADRSEGDVHPMGNPHVYMDPERMARIAEVLAGRLGSLEPGSAERFRAGAESFRKAVAARLPGWKQKAAGARGIVAFHKDVNYLAALLGVTVLGYVEPLPGIPPAASHLQELTGRLKGTRGVVVFTDYQPAQGPDFLARNLGWPKVRLPLEPAVGASAEDYLKLIDRWVDGIASGEVTAMPLLSFREVVAGYTGPVVGPVSFELDSGDVLGVVGPNGCGKSTLIGALTGTSKVFSGEVVRSPGAKIAYQRQRPVRDADVPLRADELLHLAGATAPPPETLRPLLRKRVDRLSGGQFQLLTVWACLGGEARIVILDEPTNNMDPVAVAALSDLLNASRGDRAVLVVTHDARFFAGTPARVLEVGR